MKTKLITLLSLALLFPLAACNAPEDMPQPPEDGAPEQPGEDPGGGQNPGGEPGGAPE